MFNSQKKANIVFSQILTIFFIFFLFFSYIVISLYNKLLLIWSSALNKLEAVCGCSSHFTFSNHPFLFTSITFAGLAVLIFSYLTIKKIINIKKTTNKFINNTLKHKKNNFSKKLNKVAKKLNLLNKIIEVDTKYLTVFCYGFQPKICISRQFSKKLNEEELITVLSHEQYHLKNKEPLRIFIIKSIQKILFFLPGLKMIITQYITLSEIAADEWALKIVKNRSSLASAFYKILNFKKSIDNQLNLALPFFNTITDIRINKITDEKYSYNYKILNKKILLIIFFLVSAIISFNIFIYSSKITIANHYGGGSCTQKQKNNQCQMNKNTTKCTMDIDQILNQPLDFSSYIPFSKDAFSKNKNENLFCG